MKKFLIAAVTVLALAGCATASAPASSPAPSATSASQAAPSATPAGNVPSDPGIKGCNAGTPPGYDGNQQVTFNTACDTALGNESATIGGTSPADIRSWCRTIAGTSGGTDPISKSMPACIAGVHAAMAEDGLS